jgi:hypothetical protein
MVGTQQISFGEVTLLFICQEHSVFYSYRSNKCSLFLELRLVFIFSPRFLFRSSFIFASRCIWTSGLCWYSSKELFQKGSNGVGKEKKFHAKSGTKRSMFRLRFRLFHVVLDVILIVRLVVLL